MKNENENPSTKVINESSMSIAAEGSLITSIAIVWRKKWRISSLAFAAAVLFAVVSFIMPKTYRASAIIMPPSSEGAGVMGVLSGMSLDGLLGAAPEETMRFMAIIKSRTIKERAVDRFRLIDYFGSLNAEEAVITLNDAVNIIMEDEGTIRITVSLSTPYFHPEEEEETAKRMSAEIANYFVEMLDEFNRKMKVEKASFHRQFVEERYKKNIEEMTQAEDSLKQFQEEFNIVAIEEQVKQAIQVAAAVEGQLISNEIILDVLESTTSGQHARILNLKTENQSLSRQLADLNHRVADGSDSYLFPEFSEVPRLGVEFMRLQRQVEIQNTIYTFLTQEYEQAKLQEAKDTPTIQVLDPAYEPIAKSKPRRKFIVIAGFLMGALLSSLYYTFELELKTIYQAIRSPK